MTTEQSMTLWSYMLCTVTYIEITTCTIMADILTYSACKQVCRTCTIAHTNTSVYNDKVIHQCCIKSVPRATSSPQHPKENTENDTKLYAMHFFRFNWCMPPTPGGNTHNTICPQFYIINDKSILHWSGPQ